MNRIWVDFNSMQEDGQVHSLIKHCAEYPWPGDEVQIGDDDCGWALGLVREVDLVTGLVTIQMTPGSFVATD